MHCSGNTLLGIGACIGTFLCLIPLFFGWTFDNGSYGVGNAPIYHSMKSTQFSYALVASCAISIPMLMDFILNMIILSDNRLFTRGSTVRAVLLLALFLPDLFILFISIPLQSPEVLVCMFQVRGVLCMYAIIGHLWEFGAPIFRCNFLLWTALFCMVSYIILCFSAFSKTQGFLLYYIYLGMNFLGFAMFARLGYQWWKHLVQNPLSEMTSSEYSCNVFIISTSIALIIFTIMSLVTGGTINKDTSILYLTLYTYVVAAFTISISLLQGRLITQEILNVQKSELLRLNASAETLDTLTDLQSSVDIAVNTLNELLDYEKLDAGLMRIEPETIKPGPLILDIIRPFKSQAERYGVNFTSDVGLDDMLVELQDKDNGGHRLIGAPDNGCYRLKLWIREQASVW
eukprot:gene12394-26077_t